MPDYTIVDEIEFLEAEIRRQDMLKTIVQKYALPDEDSLNLTELLKRVYVVKQISQEGNSNTE